MLRKEQSIHYLMTVS